MKYAVYMQLPPTRNHIEQWEAQFLRIRTIEANSDGDAMKQARAIVKLPVIERIAH